MADAENVKSKITDGLQRARDGYGPLLQRDYWAVIDGCEISCKEVMLLVRRRFKDFPPRDLVTFTHPEDARLLDLGDQLQVDIHMVGKTVVRVVHVDDNSMTLCTGEGHPEAGRITFGAYRNEHGDVIFHIRSRARASSRTRFAGFLTAGDPMQTNTWTDFIDRLTHTVGNGAVGVIRADVEEVEDDESDLRADQPTFRAEGD